MRNTMGIFTLVVAVLPAGLCIGDESAGFVTTQIHDPDSGQKAGHVVAVTSRPLRSLDHGAVQQRNVLGKRFLLAVQPR